ncbi:MAG: gas vesicle protein [Actinobacteria bacterium]|nr:gas vesicle protein [Actinomycetota bacterium]
MTSQNIVQPGAGAAQGYGSPTAGPEPANLADILERVLDKGLVIAGDIRVNLLDIELLTIKLRLVIASVDTARQIGINWWETDPWLHAGGDSGGRGELEQENRELRARVAELERGEPAEGDHD